MKEQRLAIMKELHDEIGHRGEQMTYQWIARQYQWKGMYDDVANYVKSCENCQKRAKRRVMEPLHPTWSTLVWEKIGVDVVFMPEWNGFKYIVFARDDLSGWVEGKALKDCNSEKVSKFLFEDVICRHGCPHRIVMDGGSENMDLTESLLQRYKIKRTNISAYHPESNGLFERGHAPVVNSIAKFCRQRNTDD